MSGLFPVGAALNSSFGRAPERGRPPVERRTLEGVSLSQPSRTIVVEPVQVPATAPAPAEPPARREAPERVDAAAVPSAAGETAARS
jgi:hypothetical protein